MTADKTIPDISSGRRFLVTGASGFIGRAVCERLLDAGASVTGTSRREVELDHPGWSHVKLDLADADGVDRLFEDSRPEFVIHLASCVTGRREIEWIRPTLVGNLQSAVNVLVAAQKSGVEKTVLAGSLEEPAEGDSHPVATSPYAVSKWGATSYARTMHALYGTRSAVARIFMVYGPGQQDLRKLVPYVCLSAGRGQAPELMSGGRPVDWIYVDDVVDGLLRLASAGPDDGSYVDLGSGELVTTGEIATRICRLAGTGVEPKLGALPDRAMEQVRKANVETTRAATGWIAGTTLDAGLAATFDWYSRLDADARAD